MRKRGEMDRMKGVSQQRDIVENGTFSFSRIPHMGGGRPWLPKGGPAQGLKGFLRVLFPLLFGALCVILKGFRRFEMYLFLRRFPGTPGVFGGRLPYPNLLPFWHGSIRGNRPGLRRPCPFGRPGGSLLCGRTRGCNLISGQIEPCPYFSLETLKKN